MTSVQVHQRRLATVRKATVANVEALWDRLPNYDKPQAVPFAQNAARVVGAGQLVTARTTTAYLTRRLAIAAPRVRPVQVTQLRRDVNPVDVYQRPFGIVWHALGDGKPLDQAIAMGRSRLNVLAATDVLLAMKAASTLVADRDPRVTGWVRVADTGACDLCSAEDGAFYEVADDMGLHPGCGCTLDPSFDSSSEAADSAAVTTHESDEVGAVLYQAGHEFSSA